MLQSHYGKQVGKKIIATMCNDFEIIASEMGARSVTAHSLQSDFGASRWKWNCLQLINGFKLAVTCNQSVIIWQLTVIHWLKSQICCITDGDVVAAGQRSSTLDLYRNVNRTEPAEWSPLLQRSVADKFCSLVQTDWLQHVGSLSVFIN